MKCESCPNSEWCPSEGSDDAPILIIGMAPGKQELVAQRPFVGGSGKILFDVVGADVELYRKNCKIMNVINCWPLGRSGEPTSEQIRACSGRFNSEILRSQARVALCLGGMAFKRLTGIASGGIENRRGYCYTPSDCRAIEQLQRIQVGIYQRDGKHGRKGDPKWGTQTLLLPPVMPPQLEWIVPSLHPAAIMREGLKTIPCLKSDVARLLRLSNGTRPVEFSYSTVMPW